MEFQHKFFLTEKQRREYESQLHVGAESRKELMHELGSFSGK